MSLFNSLKCSVLRKVNYSENLNNKIQNWNKVWNYRWHQGQGSFPGFGNNWFERKQAAGSRSNVKTGYGMWRSRSANRRRDSYRRIGHEYRSPLSATGHNRRTGRYGFRHSWGCIIYNLKMLTYCLKHSFCHQNSKVEAFRISCEFPVYPFSLLYSCRMHFFPLIVHAR